MIWRSLARRAVLTALALALTTAAQAWDSRTHQLIVRLAIGALSAGPLRIAFTAQAAQIEEHAIEPDTVLRPVYGVSEARRHYIDLENFGSDPFTRLNPDKRAMERSVGRDTLERAGTLPWSIEEEAAAMAAAWSGGDCPAMLRHAGYLAHYVGDASQPLHSTKFYDGPTAADHGMHARLEAAVDHRARELEEAARGAVHPRVITVVWPAAIAEIQRANALIPETVAADRAALGAAGSDRREFTNVLMQREGTMVTRQIIDAADVLASIWIFEWQQAEAPSNCAAASMPPS